MNTGAAFFLVGGYGSPLSREDDGNAAPVPVKPTHARDDRVASEIPAKAGILRDDLSAVSNAARNTAWARPK